MNGNHVKRGHAGHVEPQRHVTCPIGVLTAVNYILCGLVVISDEAKSLGNHVEYATCGEQAVKQTLLVFVRGHVLAHNSATSASAKIPFGQPFASQH